MTKGDRAVLRVRRVVVKGKGGSVTRQLQETLLEDTWVQDDAEEWTLQFRKEIEVRTEGTLVTPRSGQIRSPRLARLAKDLRSGKKTSLSAFWAEIEKGGSPLVEPIPDHKHQLVSFLWRGRGGEPVGPRRRADEPVLGIGCHLDDHLPMF